MYFKCTSADYNVPTVTHSHYNSKTTLLSEHNGIFSAPVLHATTRSYSAAVPYVRVQTWQTTGFMRFWRMQNVIFSIFWNIRRERSKSTHIYTLSSDWVSEYETKTHKIDTFLKIHISLIYRKTGTIQKTNPEIWQ